MEKKENSSVISEKTKVMFAIPQFIALIILVVSVSGGFISVGSTANEAKKATIENKAEIDKLKSEAHAREIDYIKSMKNIELSLEQIKGALNLKEDKK